MIGRQALLQLILLVIETQFLLGTVNGTNSNTPMETEMYSPLSTEMFSMLSTITFSPESMEMSSSIITSSSSRMSSPLITTTSSLLIIASTISSSSTSLVTASPSSTMISSTMTSSSLSMTPSPVTTTSSSTTPSSMMTSSSTMTSSLTMTSSSLSMTPSPVSTASSSTTPSLMMTSSSTTTSSLTMTSTSLPGSSPSLTMTFLSSMLSNSLSTTVSQPTTTSTILSSSTSQSVILNETTFITTSSASSIATNSSVPPVIIPSPISSFKSVSISMTTGVVSNTMQSSSSPMMVSSSSSTRMMTTTSVSSTPTGLPANILDFFRDIFEDTTILLVVAIGGPCILILLAVIFIFCCCYCCRLRKRGQYSVERGYGTRSNNDQVSSRRSISNPIPPYKMTLKDLQEERQRMDDFVETELGPESADDSTHYRGHSQVQHSQTPYSPLSDIVGTQSLSKLTPFNPSQIISEARGGISVDEIDEDVPQRDDHVVGSQLQLRQGSVALDDEGRDSPFMHLSDNLSGSRGRISQRSSSDPHTELIGQPSQASQYSHLGLGVIHGEDVVFTNTASLAEEMHNSIGMIGIDKKLLLSKDSDLHSHRTASPLLHDTSTDLDDTPVRERSATAITNQTRKLKDLTSLTSLTSLEPTKLPRSSTPTKAADTAGSNLESSRKKLDLGSITALSTSSETDHAFTHSDVVTSDLQETPERHRRHTVESSTFKRNPGKGNQSKLGKLTSIEYIRASLRMKLNRIKRNDSTDNNSTSTKNKKPLKSALRKTSSVNSQNSSPDSTNSSRNNSFIYTNHHAHHYNGFSDVSPQHGGAPNPAHFPHPVDPYDYPPPSGGAGPMMGGPDPYGPYNSMYPPPPGPVYPTRVPDPYHMVALSPPGYAPEPLSPILSVSQFDHPGMYHAPEIGILPQYGMPMAPRYDQAFPPPHYDDDDDDDIPALHSPYRPGDQGGGASQRNVTWDLEPPKEIPVRVSPEHLTPSDIDDDDL